MNDIRDYAPTSRFSDRVDDYDRYRPAYPPALIDWLVATAGLQAGDAVADIGAGTGLFTRDLLWARLKVFCVEPNAPMRAVAVRRFGATEGFAEVNGSAEWTTLPPRSVRLVTAAQAFHWFDRPAARSEFARILEPGGGVALIWNVRRIESAFAQAYERLLLTHCPDYAEGVPVQADPAIVAEFFAPAAALSERFDYMQRFDYEGLRGRLLSSSYTPKPDAPARGPLLDALQQLFETHAEAGTICFEYDTRVFYGRL